MRAGSFAAVAPLVLLLGVSVASAQRPAPQPPPQPPATAPPPPGPAALSVPNPLAGFHPGPRDLYQSPDGSDRFLHNSPYPPVTIYPGPIYPGAYYPFGYAYGPSYYEISLAETYKLSMAESYLRRQRETARGSLAIEAAPPSAQVFVDGRYAGLAGEFGPGGGAMALNAGTHGVELRAPDYETLTFSVMIEPNGLVRYRGDMQRSASKPVSATALPSQPAPAPAPAPAKSFYVIPNCYAGDKPPSGALPKGCDIKNLQTRK